MKITGKPIMETGAGAQKNLSEAPAGRAKPGGGGSLEVRDTVAVSKAAKSGEISRDKALGYLCGISRQALNGTDNEVAYLPFAEKSTRLRTKTTQISFGEAMNRLEKGKTVVFKPFVWHIGDSLDADSTDYLTEFNDEWNDHPEITPNEIHDFKELQAFSQKFRPAAPKEKLSDKEILQSLEKDSSNGLHFSPRLKGRIKAKKLSFPQAYKQLEANKNLDPQERKTVYFHPRREDFPLGLDWHNGGIILKAFPVKNSRELQEFYQMLPISY